jgi:peptidylprolyl isomerase
MGLGSLFKRKSKVGLLTMWSPQGCAEADLDGPRPCPRRPSRLNPARRRPPTRRSRLSLARNVICRADPSCGRLARVGATTGEAGRPGQAVYFEIQIDGEPAGHIVMRLYDDVVPKTARNFRELCSGQNGYGYALSGFHRIIPGFMLQVRPGIDLPAAPAGTDATPGSIFVRVATLQTTMAVRLSSARAICPLIYCRYSSDLHLTPPAGGKSIYGRRFDDENFQLRHTRPGLLSMANSGPGTNGSQFFITTVPTPHLDGKHVVFGEVADERSLALVRRIEGFGTASGKPKAKVGIAACGVVPEGAGLQAADDDSDSD